MSNYYIYVGVFKEILYINIHILHIHIYFIYLFHVVHVILHIYTLLTSMLRKNKLWPPPHTHTPHRHTYISLFTDTYARHADNEIYSTGTIIHVQWRLKYKKPKNKNTYAWHIKHIYMALYDISYIYAYVRWEHNNSKYWWCTITCTHSHCGRDLKPGKKVFVLTLT
jgi:hypothetical protein